MRNSRTGSPIQACAYDVAGGQGAERKRGGDGQRGSRDAHGKRLQERAAPFPPAAEIGRQRVGGELQHGRQRVGVALRVEAAGIGEGAHDNGGDARRRQHRLRLLAAAIREDGRDLRLDGGAHCEAGTASGLAAWIAAIQLRTRSTSESTPG